jgi:hypothetical protein
MAIPGVSKIEALATKYNKSQLAHMAQIGLIAPTEAVMAGMMIDRVMKQNMTPPKTTVAQDVLETPVPQPAPVEMPSENSGIASLPSEAPQSSGVAALPSNISEFADGGIVAFAKGGASAAAPDKAGVVPKTPYEIYIPKFNAVEVPSELTPQTAVQQNKDVQAQLGIAPDYFTKRAEQYAGDRKVLEKEKKNALADALIMGGFATAAGTSPNPFANIGAGGMKGFETYRGEIKDIRERDEKLRESQDKALDADYLMRRGDADSASKKIDESKKLRAEALNKNIEIENSRQQIIAKEATEAGKTGFTESEQTKRTREEIEARKQIASMPGDQQRMFNQIYETEKLKNPNITKLEVYKAMHTVGNKENARAQAALQYEKEWNGLTITQRDALSDRGIKTSDDYVKHNMKIYDTYYGVGGGDNKGFVIDTPQGSVRFDTKAQADAYKQKMGL